MDEKSKLSLSVALRLHWRYLIGVAIFPTISFVGSEYLHIPFPFFIPLFFGVCICAGWPLFAKRAPYSFWLVACAVWMGGAVVAVMILAALADAWPLTLRRRPARNR